MFVYFIFTSRVLKLVAHSLNVLDQEVGFDQVYGQKNGAKSIQKHRPWPVLKALLTSSLSHF